MQPLTRTHKVWRVRVLSATWLSYAGFYFCRKNFSIAKSSIQDALQISTTDLAHLSTAYLVAYMLGQFLTSFLGQRTAARTLLLGGMAIAVLANVMFGVSYLMGPAGYWPMLFFMVINGFAQATGWPSNIGVLSNWLRRAERGRFMSAWATCYQLGSIFAKGFAAFMLGWLGATWSFWGAAGVLFGVWIAFYFLERDRPEDVGLSPIVEEIEIQVPVESDAPPEKVNRLGWTPQVALTVFFMGSVYFVFKFLRYALDSWTPMAAEQLFHLERANAGYLSTVFDWVGFLGVIFGGVISDKLFAGRRYQTIFLMTVGMFLAFVFLSSAGPSSVLLFAVGLSLCGFMLMGPDSLLSGVGAIDVGGRGGAIVAAGVINGLGSVGPIFQEEMIGVVLDRYGYGALFKLLIAVSLLGVIGTGYLSIRCRQGKSSL